MKRRTYLTVASATAAATIAGCMGGDDVDNETNTTDDDDDGTPDDDAGDDTGVNGDDDGSSDDDNGDDDGDDHSELVGTFDDFEDLSAWSTILGSLEPDTGVAFEGSQSAFLSTSESEDQVRIARELEEPIDVEGLVPGLALATSAAATPTIQLHDADGNVGQYRQHVRVEHPFHRHNFGHTSVSGDVNMSEITEIQIVYWTGEEHEGELWVDDLHFVPHINTGQVLIQFQGGHESDYTHAFPILEAHDLTASTFVPTSRIRPTSGTDGSRLTESQLDELVDAGWSLGTVGARGLHMNTYSEDEIESEVLSPLEWFDEHGYDDANYYAFPGGRYNEEMFGLVEDNYELGWAGRHRSQGWAANPYTLTRISGEVGRRNLDASDVVDAIDWTAEHGGLTTIVYYMTDEEDTESLEAMASRIAELRDAGDLEVITPDEIANQYVL